MRNIRSFYLYDEVVLSDLLGNAEFPVIFHIILWLVWVLEDRFSSLFCV